MIRDESSGSLLGRSLGTGLGEGLAALIEGKMKSVKKSNFADLLGKQGGFGEDKGRILAELSEIHPQKFNELLMALSQGQQPEQQQEVNPLAPQQKSSFAQDLARGVSQQQEATPAQQKAQAELKNSGENLLSTYNNVKKLQGLINEGAQFGAFSQIANIFGNNALQSLTNPATAIYDQTAQEYLTNVTQNLKGRVLAGQQKALERAKPGINKSKEANESALKDAEKVLSRRIKQFSQENPGVIDEESLPEIFGSKNVAGNRQLDAERIKEAHKELPPAKNFDEEDAWETKNGVVFEIKNGGWVLSKE